MNKLKRLINRENFCNFGAIICGVNAFILLLQFAVNFLLYGITDLSSILRSAINVVFYILVCRDFINGKSNFQFAYNGILYLLICDYVIPLIFDGFQSLFNSITLLSLFLGLGLGVLYFVFLVLENKKREPKYIVWMRVLAIIMLVFSFLSAAIMLYGYSSIFAYVTIPSLAENGANIFDYIFNYISFGTEIVSSLLPIGFAIIYTLYPSVLLKERM